MPTQIEKAHAFRALHERSGPFVIPNPWDPGSARLLTALGFEALTSTSAGFAFSRGLPDYGVGRDPILVHIAELVAATDLPVAADLENGFGDDPYTVAETIRLAAATGIVGGSIEDASGRADAPIYPFEASVERVRAAVEATRALPFPFTLTARAENYLHGRNDLAEGRDPGLLEHEQLSGLEPLQPRRVLMRDHGQHPREGERARSLHCGDAAPRLVQQPADVDGQLLRLGSGEQHAERERVQEPSLADPSFALDELLVHERDLPAGPAEVDEPQLHPEPEGFAERDAG